MARRLARRTCIIFAVVALVTILVSGGILAACSRTQTTTSAPAAITTSTSTRITTSAPAPTGVSAADFYKANVTTIVVPYSPGGGVDYLARLFANSWTEVTGDRMVVVNKEAAVGMEGTNYAYAAKPDGLTIGISIPGSTLMPPVLARDPAVKYDIKQMNWIGFTNPEVQGVGVGVKSPANNMQEFAKIKGLKFAAADRSGANTLGAGVVIELFGMQDARIVCGYGSSAEALLAAGKGEVDSHIVGYSVLIDSFNKGMVKKPFAAVGFERSPYDTSVPAIPELVNLTPEQQTLLKTYGAFQNGQVFWFGPGVPQDRIDFVRNAFDKIVANENFLKLAKTRWIVWVTPTSGKDYAPKIAQLMASATPENFDQLLKVANKYVR